MGSAIGAGWDAFRARAAAAWRAIEPGDGAWKGGARGLALASAAIVVYRAIDPRSATATAISLLIGLPLALAIAAGSGLAVLIGARLIAALRIHYGFVLVSCVALLSINIFGGSLFERALPTLYVVFSSTVAGAALGVLFRWRSPGSSRRRTILAALAFAGSAAAGVIGLRWLFAEGDENAPQINAAAASNVSVTPLDLPDPSQPGPMRVRRIFYGTGQSAGRPEYGARADLRSKPVDGSRWLTRWRGFDGWARRRMLKFGPEALPINGRMFVPEGAGPFPVVVFVHGAHPMSDPSDPGYDYLGEHLATHGFAAVSVDENFLNVGAWAEIEGSLSGENGARGWLVLEHLRALSAWNADASGPLHGKLDLDHVALAGHSRGGEAVTLAALFNRMTHHPDDATNTFSYGFGIRGVIALASTDGQYQPAGVPVALTDVDFLALQGSNDADVERWEAHQQYDRVTVAPGSDHFKAAVYVHRANHGQWNRGWGRYDKSRFPKRLYFNRKPVLGQASQERVARAYLTAFAAASLRGEKRFRAFLEDHRAGRRWLPDTIFLSRYEDGARRYLARFDEDVDVATATLPGARIEGQNLTSWREQPAVSQAFWSLAENRAAFLGWTPAKKGASYTITLPPDLDRNLVQPGGALVFALADANELPRGGSPRSRPRPPINLSVELADAAGRTARVPLSSVGLLQAQIETDIWKLKLRMSPRREIVFQTFSMPLRTFVQERPDLDLTGLRAVRFVFDRTPAGTIMLDDVGIAPPG